MQTWIRWIYRQKGGKQPKNDIEQRWKGKTENRIRDVVNVGKQFGATKEKLTDRIQKSHGIDLKNAMEKVEFYWNQPESTGNEF